MATAAALLAIPSAPHAVRAAPITLTPSADAYVSQASATQNFGTDSTLRADGTQSAAYRSFIRFRVSGLSGSVQSVVLRVYCTTDGTLNGPAVYLASNSWNESGKNAITWKKQPAVTGSAAANAGTISTQSWVSYDVTSLVTGNGTFTLALLPDSSDGVIFSSREGSNGPQLVITPAGTPTSTPTATALPSTNTATATLPPSTATRTPTATNPPPSPTSTSAASPAPATPPFTPLPSTAIATSTSAAPTNTPVLTPVPPSPTSTLAPATSTPTPTGAGTPTAGTGQSQTFVPQADAYVSSSYPTTNYGTGTTLRVDGSPDVHSYVRFTVSGLGGAAITRARLYFYANSASTAGLQAAAVSDNSWVETSVNYNNAPAVGAVIASSGAAATGAWVTMDVSSYVTGEGTYSFGILTPGATAISLASRESGANAPQLIVDLSGAGGATSTPTATAPGPTATATLGPTPTAGASGPIQHVFLVLMENHSYDQVWNTSSTPYITQLGNSYVRATNYYAVTHPSLPNYLDLYGGDNYGITNDCLPSSTCHVNAVSMADNLEAKGLTWRAYLESMPSPCYLTNSGNYAPKHNPFVYFDPIQTDSARCNGHDVPYDQLAGDLASAATTPNFVFLKPDLCNDMHSCSISTGDTWLANHVPDVLNSPACTADTCLLILSFDEDDGNSANHVLTIFAGSAAKTGGATSGTLYNHFSLLRTIEDIFGLPMQTANDAAASPMTDMLR